MSEAKFRAWDGKSMIEPYSIRNGKCYIIKSCDINEEPVTHEGVHYYKNWDIDVCTEYPVMQFTGLQDCNGVDYYLGYIGEFDNGDRFVLKMEDFLQVFVSWIGEPECEDQARDLYRISKAKVIGNIHMNPELLDSNNGNSTAIGDSND